MKFIELHKQIKNEIKKIYRIEGNDLFLINQAILTLKKEIVKTFEEFNFVKLDGEKLKVDDLFVNLETLPVADDLRLIVLNGSNSELSKFINSYNFDAGSTVLLCVNSEKVTKGEIIDCTALDKSDISRYILNILAKAQLSIEESALEYIISATNGDMLRINNELQKLIAYCDEIKVVNMEVVTNLISNSNEYVIFMLTNALDKRDLVNYQVVLNSMKENQTYNEIFAYMGKYFKRMFYIAINKNDEELSRILGIKPYAVKVSRQNVKDNGVQYYVNLYKKYVELDYQIKSGKISASNAMYKLVF